MSQKSLASECPEDTVETLMSPGLAATLAWWWKAGTSGCWERLRVDCKVAWLPVDVKGLAGGPILMCSP